MTLYNLPISNWDMALRQNDLESFLELLVECLGRANIAVNILLLSGHLEKMVSRWVLVMVMTGKTDLTIKSAGKRYNGRRSSWSNCAYWKSEVSVAKLYWSNVLNYLMVKRRSLQNYPQSSDAYQGTTLPRTPVVPSVRHYFLYFSQMSLSTLRAAPPIITEANLAYAHCSLLTLGRLPAE